jgi:two-component system cell cycle sensor histidine kinase/response regulator CckA
MARDPVQPEQAPPVPKRPIKVLLIEDNPGDARLILDLLGEVNADDFELEHVDRLGTALERLRDAAVDIVLLDLTLPENQGLDALIRAQRDAPQKPIVVIASEADEHRALEALRSGAQDYLVKGRIEGQMLARVIRYAIERKESEKRLRESEERFRELAENVREVFFVTDADTGRLLYTNPAYETVFGQSREYAYSKPLAWTEVVQPDDRPHMMAAPRTVAELGQTTVNTFRVVQPDGTHRWLRSRSTPVKDAAGKFSRVVGIVEDITELRRAEEQFHKAQKMEAVGRLAGGVAHDFNNLLVAIIGTADLLLADLGLEDPRRADVQEISKAGWRAASVTRQLLAFSRQQVLERKVLNVNVLVADLEKLLVRVIGEDVELKTVLAPDVGNVRADSGQLEQVIMNLAVNSRDAMPHGGKLTIETAMVDLDESFARLHEPLRPGRYVMVAVSDSGTGMSEVTKDRIFEPFFTTKGLGKGTGLGLATVYGIVKQSDGHVWVYSELGHGTTFKIYLPGVDQPTTPHDRPSGGSARLTGTESILLVEDDEQVRASTRRMLASLGYRAVEAEGGAQALEMVQGDEGTFDLLITDVVMPGLSGPRLMAAVRQQQPGLRALYLSGYSDESIVLHGVLESGVPFLQKPFSLTALARKVREVLDADVPPG